MPTQKKKKSNAGKKKKKKNAVDLMAQLSLVKKKESKGPKTAKQLRRERKEEKIQKAVKASAGKASKMTGVTCPFCKASQKVPLTFFKLGGSVFAHEKQFCGSQRTYVASKAVLIAVGPCLSQTDGSIGKNECKIESG